MCFLPFAPSVGVSNIIALDKSWSTKCTETESGEVMPLLSGRGKDSKQWEALSISCSYGVLGLQTMTNQEVLTQLEQLVTITQV